MNTAEKSVLEFMRERHSIYLKRAGGDPPPWTKDPILAKYKFTNVYRENDRVSRWIKDNIMLRYAGDRYMWFMLCIARQINWPQTLEELMRDRKGAWPCGGKWSPERAREVMLARAARGDKVYTGAYMLNAQLGRYAAGAPLDKAYFTCNVTLAPLWRERQRLGAALTGASLASVAAELRGVHGWGPFLAAQVVADLKMTRYLQDAPDWWTWAAPGPGSRRGLNRVLGRPLRQAMPEDKWLSEINKLREKVNSVWPHPPLCAQNMQNVLCEVDKYLRVKLGEGRPRAYFKPTVEA